MPKAPPNEKNVERKKIIRQLKKLKGSSSKPVSICYRVTTINKEISLMAITKLLKTLFIKDNLAQVYLAVSVKIFFGYGTT